MKSFDEWWEENYMILSADRTEAEDIYNVGAQSKQAEVDELQKNLNKALKTIEIQQRFLDDADGANKILTIQASELRKRIDKALNKSEDFYDFGDGESAMAFCNEIINILKGKINDH